MKVDLSGKVALVAGSTDSIGKAVALGLARNGADVVVNGRNQDNGLAVVKEIEKMGQRGMFKRADLREWKEVKGMVDSVLGEWGKIDIMVGSGGAGSGPKLRLFSETDPELYEAYFKSRLFPRFYCARAVLDHMREKQKGKIIFISSDAGRVPTIGESVTGAAWAGVVLATKALAREFAAWKIHVNAICTTVVAESYEQVTSDSPTKMFNNAVKRMPFWPLRTKDIAEMALFLASEDSDRITGQVFSVNGGLSFPG